MASQDAAARVPQASAEEATTTESVPNVAVAYSEAPILAERVAAGNLPPVDERLPVNPLVVEPVESIGKYGGTWRRAYRGINDFHSFGRVNYEPMLRWPRDPSDPIQPGLAERWEWSEDGTALTLYLRKGIKWSDGVPFTTTDITFWWEDIELDKALTPAPHTEWVVNGEPMELIVIDDHTITLQFVAPNGLVETVGLAFHGNQWPLGFERFGFFAPRHYLEQFHPTYNAEATYELFDEKALDFNIERPVLTPWRITEWHEGAPEMIAERNPYYWKVDPLGNQLPYIDRLHFTFVKTTDEINDLALAGKLDMQARGIDFSRIELFRQNAEAGNYHIGQWSSASPSDTTFYPNQSYPDSQYRALIQDVRFRQALSLAIDRELINFLTFLGQAVDSTQSVVRDSALYQSDIDTLLAIYDPDHAIALLDELGLPIDEDGYRMFADGRPINLVVETHRQSGSHLDAIEIALENWNDIGLRTTLFTMTRDEYWPRASDNKVMIGVWGMGRGLTPLVDPIYQFPFDERSWMAPAFGMWYKTSGELGEEPTPEFRESMALYDRYRASANADEQFALAKDLVRLAAERLYTVNTIGEPPTLVIIQNDFKNVIENDFTADWIIMSPGTQDPSQYYFDR